MNEYAKQLQSLHSAVIGEGDAAMLPLVEDRVRADIPREQRIAVYSDGYVIRLVEATLSDYPALANYMEEGACQSAITEFVQQTRSVFWDLNHYPVAFAEFFAQHAADQAAVALAQLESSIANVFWAAESDALTAESLQTLSEEELGAKQLPLRGASDLLHLPYQAEAYLTAFRAGSAPESIAEGEEILLVLRHNNEVQRLSLEPQEYQILQALNNGVSFNDALQMVESPEALEQKLPAFLSRWLQSGVFAA